MPYPAVARSPHTHTCMHAVEVGLPPPQQPPSPGIGAYYGSERRISAASTAVPGADGEGEQLARLEPVFLNSPLQHMLDVKSLEVRGCLVMLWPAWGNGAQHRMQHVVHGGRCMGWCMWHGVHWG